MRNLSLSILILLTVVAAAQEFPTVKAFGKGFPVKTDLGDFMGCGLQCAMGWKTTAGDQIPSKGELKYDGQQSNDDDFSTCWSVLPDSVAPWIDIKFSEYGTTGTPWRGITIANGYAKSPELWKKNGRVRRLAIELNGKHLHTVTLLDTPAIQSITIPAVEVKSGDTIRLTVIDTYPGTHYPEVCVSEIGLSGAH